MPRDEDDYLGVQGGDAGDPEDFRDEKRGLRKEPNRGQGEWRLKQQLVEGGACRQAVMLCRRDSGWTRASGPHTRE